MTKQKGSSIAVTPLTKDTLDEVCDTLGWTKARAIEVAVLAFRNSTKYGTLVGLMDDITGDSDE